MNAYDKAISDLEKAAVAAVKPNGGFGPYVVIRVERGRRGEDRTVYLLMRQKGDGTLTGGETRGHSIRKWKLIGRLSQDELRQDRIRREGDGE